MQIENRRLVAAALMAVCAGQLSAGGLSDPIIPVPIAPPPIVSQNDWYIGVQVGPGFGELSYDEEDISLDGDADGIFYGVHVGVQRRFGTFTAGVELDYNAGNFQSEIEETAGGLTGDVEITTLAHLKARLGTDYGRAFVYGTAGLAYVEGSSEVPALVADFSGTGGFAGFGSDFRLNDRFSVGGEVLFHDFEDIDDSMYSAQITTAQLRLSYHF